MSARAIASLPATPAGILIAHLGLEKRVSAEIEDLYSRPIPSPEPLAVPRAA